MVHDLRGKNMLQVRGFNLNVRGSRQLNYQIMRDNVLKEIEEPLEERRQTTVHNSNFFTRDATTKRLKVIPRDKQYGLVYDKRVVDPSTFTTYPYGYKPLLQVQDMIIVNTLLDL